VVGLEEQEKPVLEKPLTSFIPEKLTKPGKAEEEKTRRFEMWAPSVVRTRGLSHALKWLMENLPEAPTVSEAFLEFVLPFAVPRQSIATIRSPLILFYSLSASLGS